MLIGDLTSVEIGAKNILLNPDEQTKFSSQLYDLYGQQISVVNLLGQQSIEKLPLIQGKHALLLLIPNGQHVSHYKSGVQWLEKTFGRQSLAHLMTVVTCKSGENCESALTDLRAFDSFDEERYHTCSKSMTETAEVVDLMLKISIMVSENSPHCYTGLIPGENTEENKHLESKSLGELMDPSVLKENKTGEILLL